MFFVVLSSAPSAPFGFETSVSAPRRLKQGESLLAYGPEEALACWKSDELSRCFGIYAEALDETGCRLHAQAASGLTRSQIAKFEEITDRA
jgi:hypothetical protein